MKFVISDGRGGYTILPYDYDYDVLEYRDGAVMANIATEMETNHNQSIDQSINQSINQIASPLTTKSKSCERQRQWLRDLRQPNLGDQQICGAG